MMLMLYDAKCTLNYDYYYGDGGRCTTAPPPLNKLPGNYHIMVVYILILVCRGIGAHYSL